MGAAVIFGQLGADLEASAQGLVVSCGGGPEPDRIEGLGWHGLRRKLADDLHDAPLEDLADLGGGRTPRTILEVYQDSDHGAMRRALEDRRPARNGGRRG
jgi:hypothetical protein